MLLSRLLQCNEAQLLVAGRGERPGYFLEDQRGTDNRAGTPLPTGEPSQERNVPPVCVLPSALQSSVFFFSTVNHSICCSQINLKPRLPAWPFCILQTPNEIMRRIELGIHSAPLTTLRLTCCGANPKPRPSAVNVTVNVTRQRPSQGPVAVVVRCGEQQRPNPARFPKTVDR